MGLQDSTEGFVGLNLRGYGSWLKFGQGLWPKPAVGGVLNEGNYIR